MPANGYAYNLALYDIVRQTLNLETITSKVMLVGESYTFNPEHQYRNQITGELVNDTGDGYEQKTVSLTISRDGGIVMIDCADIDYLAIKTTAAARAAIFFEDTGDAATDRVIVYNQGITLVTNGSDVTARIPTEGIYEFVNQLPA